MKSHGAASATIATLVRAVATALAAAPAASQVKPVLKAPVSGDVSKEAVVVTGGLPPGGTTGRHALPGDEYSLVLQGSLALRADGRAPRHVGAGEANHNPKDLIHEAKNVGDAGGKVESVSFDSGQSAVAGNRMPAALP